MNDRFAARNALFEQDIDDFFNFKEFRQISSTSVHDEPKKTPLKDVKTRSKAKKEDPKAPRKFSGFDYVGKYQTQFQKSLCQDMEGLNVTGLTSLTSFRSELTLNETFSNFKDQECASQMINNRKDLPIFKYHEKIIDAIHKNPIVMICGPTGCGKSTQIPQYIYDSYMSNKEVCNILVSQPRKIAAVTLAQRVAEERGVPLGSLVGYQVGLNRCLNLSEESTQITFCTTGVVLQKLLHQKSMASYSHIILDEVHERDLDIDFLMTILRRLNPLQTNTKIILMSATLDIQKFQNFWKFDTLELSGEYQYPPIIDLDANARKYEISERYIDDIKKIDVTPDIIDVHDPGISNEMYSYASKLVHLILRLKSGERPNILIFLPGLPEIERLQEEFINTENDLKFKEYDPEIHILHSSLSVEEQKRVFENSGKIKIILATNIAESSVTIPKVSYVIDFCLTKYLKHYKGSQMSSHVMGWASKNNCKQRAGRTGRVGRGVVFRLVFKEFYHKCLLEHSIPEIKLAPLESIIVKIKQFNMGSPLEILADSIDPPDESLIVNGVLTLKEHGGLLIYDKNGIFQYHDGDLTFLGEIMASLPCDIRITKLIVLGYMFSVLDEAIIIAAGLNFKGIFLTSLKNKMQSYCRKMKWSNGTGSDSIATYNAYSCWIELRENNFFRTFEDERQWCREHGLDLKCLNEMRLWIFEVKERLKQFKIENLPYPNQPFWRPLGKILMIKAVLAGAFGVSNFFLSTTQTDFERDAFSIFNNSDIFHSVYLRNMDRKIEGDVYKKQIKQTLIEKGVCDENSDVDVYFDRNSERVYISFNDENFSENDEHGFASGYVVPEVYKAVRLRKIEGTLKLHVLTPAQTINYALEQRFGECSNTGFRVHYPTLKNPEYWPYPTRSTKSMKGFISHVEHCNKFFFCPLIAYNTMDELKDSRYEYALNSIKSLLMNLPMDPISGDMKLTRGRMIVYKNTETMEFDRAEFIKYINDRNVEIRLIDRGCKIESPLKFINIVKKEKNCEMLEKYPPRVFECKLREIEPSCMQSFGNKWSSKAITYFRDGVQNKDAIIEVYSIVNDVVTVELTTEVDNITTCWNQKLVSDGYAQECEESYGSKMDHDRRLSGILSCQKPCDPKIEFAQVIDKRIAKTIEIDAPDKSQCINTISLIGPYSPLETTLRGVSVDISGLVTVDALSINHVLINDDLMSFHDKFFVAADVSMGARNANIKLRETTAMPNIPGLAVLMALIFSPNVQLRRDIEKTRYTSLISGLGFDENYQKSYFYERDAIQLIDFDLSSEDISDINRLRFNMSSLLYRDPFHKCPNLNDRQREQILRKIKDLFTLIINKKHLTRDIQTSTDQSKWNIDQDDSFRHTSRFGHCAIWDYIPVPPLQAIPITMKEQLIKHVKDLEDSFRNAYIQECRLCGVPLNSSNSLNLHLLSKMHILRKKQLGIS